MTLKVLYKNGEYAFISDVYRYNISKLNPNVIEIEYRLAASAYITYLSMDDMIYIGEQESISDNVDFYHICKD